MLKPGNYELSPSMTMDQMLAVMAGSGTGRNVNRISRGLWQNRKFFGSATAFCIARRRSLCLSKTAAADDSGYVARQNEGEKYDS